MVRPFSARGVAVDFFEELAAKRDADRKSKVTRIEFFIVGLLGFSPFLPCGLNRDNNAN
jgi:hypothetical protein